MSKKEPSAHHMNLHLHIQPGGDTFTLNQQLAQFFTVHAQTLDPIIASKKEAPCAKKTTTRR